ncbi:PD40 domain-containing protein [candidate division KSB1 bacterium]|nr:PD40 domain-containing protein [candidate division KSB1 bacterium]
MTRQSAECLYPYYSPDCFKIVYWAGIESSERGYYADIFEMSADGRKIIFESDRDGNDEIYSMNIDGSELTRLTDNNRTDFQATVQYQF